MSMTRPNFNTDRFPWIILIGVFLIQSALGLTFHLYQLSDLETQEQDRFTANFNMLATLLHTDLQNYQYQAIEPLLNQWVGLYEGSVIHVDFTSGNGFVFFEYENGRFGDAVLSQFSVVNYSYEGMGTLSVRWSLDSVHVQSRKTLFLLVFIQLITTLTLMFFLHLASRRKRDAKLLADRALALDISNRNLQSEMNERKAVEKNLAREKEQLQVTLLSLGEGVISLDRQGMVMLANPIAEKMMNYHGDGCVGKSVDQVLVLEEEQPGASFKLFASGYLKQTDSGSKELILKPERGDDRLIYLGFSSVTDEENELTGWVIVLRDISGTRRLEQEQHKNSMLEALGVLAGGIAHDFNNILMAISGNLSLAQELINTGSFNKEELVETIFHAENATERAADLTRQLLTFAKGGSPILDATALDEVVKEAADFVLHGADLNVTYNFDSDLMPVNMDKNQIGQVVQNLVINARQAMPSGGHIVISGTNENEIQTDQKCPIVKLTISDEGVGIPVHDLDHIFDPYYTTKKEGSGLGLALAYSIISKHNGSIEVQSVLNVGTTFTIFLPGSTKAIPALMSYEASEVKGVGRIMIMDDDDAVRLITSRMISKLGFEVVSAEHGLEAIEIYQEYQKRSRGIDLVIMDLTIPKGMGGQETIKRMLENDPECRAIVASGYSNDPVMANFEEYGFKAALVKPFNIRQLGKILEDVLNIV